MQVTSSRDAIYGIVSNSYVTVFVCIYPAKLHILTKKITNLFAIEFLFNFKTDKMLIRNKAGNSLVIITADNGTVLQGALIYLDCKSSSSATA